MRRTFGTHLAQAGDGLYKISKLLSHKDIKITQRYAHHCHNAFKTNGLKWKDCIIKFHRGASTTSNSGIAGTDSLWLSAGGGGTAFDPEFTSNTIEVGFETNFGTGTYFFGEGSWLSFAGLDNNGMGRITGVSMTETVADNDLSQSDLSFDAFFLKIQLGNVLLKRGGDHHANFIHSTRTRHSRPTRHRYSRTCRSRSKTQTEAESS